MSGLRCITSTSTRSSRTSDSSGAAARRSRQTAAKRRVRQRRSGRDAELLHLTSLLKDARQKLAVEKECAASLAGEHFKVSQELRRALDQAVLDRREADAKLSTVGAALLSDYNASLRRLEALHKIELEGTRAKATAARKQDLLELDRLTVIARRLRAERDQARADSLRYNEERNVLRKEVAELRVRQSEEAVRDASRVRLSFPGACAE